MHILEKKIHTQLLSSHILPSQTGVGVALSGGADSVALLAALVALGYRCTALHCNFHLRGPESDRDMHHSISICSTLGVPILVRHFDVDAQRRSTGESVEMACRTLRYDWFRTRPGYTAVAHHREDNTETFFLNLLRSTGIDGLTGMKWQNDNILRPMLDVTRPEIEDYLAVKHLSFITDSTNTSNTYRRNRLRNIILPYLEQNFPGAANAITATIENLRPAALLVDDAVKMWIRRVNGTPQTLNIKKLIEIAGEERSKLIIFQHLKQHGLNATQATDIINAVKAGRSGKHFPLKTHTAILDRGILTLNQPNTDDLDTEWPIDPNKNIRHPVRLEITTHPITDFHPDRNPDILYLDPRHLPNPLILRHPRRGDRFQPFGMKGTRLLSDIFNDLKLTTDQRRRAWLLSDGKNILWILGYRPSAHYPVTPTTPCYLRLELLC